MRKTLLSILLTTPLLAAAQGASYAGEQTRTIKALSEQEVQQYLAGAGMGYARPAELNRYPGPMHVLELADRLKLDARQRADMKALMDDHKNEARGLGARVVAAERALDALFVSRAVDGASLTAALTDAQEARRLYRESHLQTHLKAAALMTPEQIAAYSQLRGYDDGNAAPAGNTQHQHKH
jgi:Spy/CpxP family protein refolding chaperone